MTISERAVIVKQLPEISSAKQERTVLREIQALMNVDRPRMVLDCSNLRQLDSSTIHLLLCCLEEAMKRNGDVKLAALPHGAGAILELTGVNRIFDIYDTAAEAVDSFHQPSTDAVSQKAESMHSDPEPDAPAYRLGSSRSGVRKVSTGSREINENLG